jgi:serine/threonine-protein kinase
MVKPRFIGRYEIERELGRGGMAVVYLARDPLMNRHVAVKVLPRQFTFDPGFLQRFHREAQVIATLEHPAIVPVYDFGEHDGQPYIVMRYMPGGSLADRLEKGPLAPAEAARILEHLAPALDEAHARGIIHRDLKPANILFDHRDRPYLCDFGIVKLSEGSTTALTASGGILGTPAYMSPEQARGNVALDGRTDVYSLGVILFEMLTGAWPYEADTPMGLAMMHVLEPVPRVLDRRPNLPPDCQRIITGAMAKDRDQRFPTAAALAAAAACLTGAKPSVPSSAAPPATVVRPAPSSATGQPPARVVRAERPRRRRKVPLWLIGIAVLILAALAAPLVVGGILSPTSTSTPTPTFTPTATSPPVATSTPTITLSPAPSATLPASPTLPLTSAPTSIASPTSTPMSIASPTPIWTPTSIQTLTETPTPSPTLSNTPLPRPTNTPPPAPTSTPLPLPTNTPLPPPTNTPLPAPTNTPLPQPTQPPATNTPPP